MPLTVAEFQDRYQAAVLGLAIGDALGFPLRGVPRASLWRAPSLADDFAPRPRGRFAKGQFSDDTQLMLASADSVVREQKVDGRSLAAHYAWLWQQGVILQPPRPLADALQRLAGGASWMSAGAPAGTRDPSVLSRALVCGLWNAGQVARLSHDAEVMAIVTHKDAVCAAAAAAYARAVGLGLEDVTLTPQEFCEELAHAASTHDAGLAEELRYLHRALAWDVGQALGQLSRIGVPPSQLEVEEGLPAHVVPVLLTALYAALKVPNDYRAAVTLALQAGGESDVAAALCGGLLGAHLGTEALPSRLRRTILYSDHLHDTAQRLWQARLAAASVAPLVTARSRRS
ncbi:MAG: ADP-ribosylglycohydrolase family protein [Myxococcaceae bacterium]|nr:ADP-ribosylglycohydrolase family protein [Myxococcaceae bacterium]